MKLSLLAAWLLCAVAAHAQLAVTVSPVKVIGQKAVVPLAMKNGFGEKIESARAVVFLLDEQGKLIGQATKWVIGGSLQTATGDKPGLAAGATNVFLFAGNPKPEIRGPKEIRRPNPKPPRLPGCLVSLSSPTGGELFWLSDFGDSDFGFQVKSLFENCSGRRPRLP